MSEELEQTEGKATRKTIMVTLADGTEVKRAEYIRQRWVEDRVKRSEIAKELSEMSGKKIPYQIVFAATKGLDGGPVKDAA